MAPKGRGLITARYFRTSLSAVLLALSLPLMAGPGRAADSPLFSGAIPALTPVELVIEADLGSKASKTGETFPLKLHRDLMINGRVVIPANTPGQGEVVWAKPSGGSGASGELVLAARFLDVNGRHLRLRSMHVAPVGADKIAAVNQLAVATAATMPAVGLIGYFISGKQAVVVKGTVAGAKTAENFSLEGAAPESSAAVPPKSAAGAEPASANEGKNNADQ